jgi:hypothetical protein
MRAGCEREGRKSGEGCRWWACGSLNRSAPEEEDVSVGPSADPEVLVEVGGAPSALAPQGLRDRDHDVGEVLCGRGGKRERGRWLDDESVGR